MRPEVTSFPHDGDLQFPTNLPESDGEPLESEWHRLAMSLLIEVVRYYLRARHDFFVGGNMFLYFSAQQARTRDYRGPDFFFVWGVERDKLRPYWAVWDEDGKYPNVIIELLSPTTAEVDRTTKKDLYAHTFRTPEYFLYDPSTRELQGWHLTNGDYEPMESDERGWIWSRQLELYIGKWEGEYLESRGTWLRFFDVHGNLILTGREDLQRRADELEAELDRVRKQLAARPEQGGAS